MDPWLREQRLKWTLIPLLVVGGAVCLTILLRDPAFDRRQLGMGVMAEGGVRRRARLLRIAGLFLLPAAGLAAYVMLFEPERLFWLPRNNTQLWLTIMFGYPLLSVYPQEVMFRAFMFHRYRSLFPRPWMMIGASAVAFGYAHIVLHNWVAVVMTLVGGAVFARTYAMSRSTVLTSVEHALYGCFIFTIGMGSYFYAGAMR
ncbi:MAG: CPBP family intramembrane metalloprotease [Phycisphaerales bacterium]|nr:CPBP family intramembrane metalloprotease [Phycisphaerales bacterium]